tara:strand:- start:150 stop:530 length:381 start_codon:yes stop_codon:yes gene_type:complete
MFFWTIKWSITSFILISFIHYFYEFFKNKFTKQKVYNILNNNNIDIDNNNNMLNNTINQESSIESHHDTTVIANIDTTVIANIDTTVIGNIDTTVIGNIDTTMSDTNNGEMKEELLNFINTLKNDS